jgi:hypothetical protein
LELEIDIHAVVEVVTCLILIIQLYCFKKAVLISPFVQVAFLVVFLNDFATDFALGAVSVALDGVGHRLVCGNHVLAVVALQIAGQSLVAVEAVDHGLFASKISFRRSCGWRRPYS